MPARNETNVGSVETYGRTSLQHQRDLFCLYFSAFFFRDSDKNGNFSHSHPFFSLYFCCVELCIINELNK